MPLDTGEQLDRSAGHGRGAIISKSRTRAPASYRSSRSSCEIEDVTPASDTTSQSMAESSALRTAALLCRRAEFVIPHLQVPGHERSARA